MAFNNYTKKKNLADFQNSISYENVKIDCHKRDAFFRHNISYTIMCKARVSTSYCKPYQQGKTTAVINNNNIYLKSNIHKIFSKLYTQIYKNSTK